MVANKRCVVVAPSYYLKGRQHGTFIDEFDIVAKCNDFYDLQDEGENDLGKRCDIWYGLPQQRSYQFDYEKCKNKLNPRHLRIQARLPSYGDFWDQTMLEFEEKNQSFGFDYSVIESGWYADLAERIGCMPMTGILAIFDLLEHGASEIYALGFDFMKSGYYNDYPIDTKVELSGWHKNANLKEALHKLLMSENRFSCDSHLENILSSELNESFDPKKSFEINLIQECKQFFDPCAKEPILMIRSSNRFSFDTALSQIRKFNEANKIHIISSSENRSESNEPEIYFHTCEENKISLQTIKDSKALKELKFQYCLVGYNGQSLFEYLNIFKVLSALHCSKIFLVSEMGFLQKIESPDLYVSEISEFLLSKDRFNYLNTKYNRENCI
jgi:hypothetical protein